MAKKQPGAESDDFGGMSRSGAVVLLTAVALRHPWQALTELLAASRRLGHRPLGLAMTPAALVAATLWSRRQDRRPSFEDYLRSRGDDELPR